MEPTRTRRQREVFEYITSYIDRHGYEPSYQMIARHLGVHARSGIVKHIEALEQLGFIKRKRENGGFRLEVIRQEHAAGPGKEIEWLFALDNENGRAEWERAPLVVPEFMLGGLEPSEIYAFRVPDDAMAGRDIHEGDVALIERRAHFRDGTSVAVTIDNSGALLRKHYRDGAHIELRSANDEFPPVRVSADEIEINGVFRGLLRPIS